MLCCNLFPGPRSVRIKIVCAREESAQRCCVASAGMRQRNGAGDWVWRAEVRGGGSPSQICVLMLRRSREPDAERSCL